MIAAYDSDFDPEWRTMVAGDSKKARATRSSSGKVNPLGAGRGSAEAIASLECERYQNTTVSELESTGMEAREANSEEVPTEEELCVTGTV